MTPPVAHIQWPEAWRIIPSRFPPIDIFEELADSTLLAELEGLSNPRLREQWGDISLVPAARRVTGPGATYVMAPFTHPNKEGSRFSSGVYGLYYAASSLETAIRETVYHMSLFYARTPDGPHQNQFRALVGVIDHDFHDIRQEPPVGAMANNDYSSGQALGARLRDDGSNGIIYLSVRHPASENIAAFWPDVVGIPVQERHLTYNWTGQAIDKIYDFKEASWLTID